MKLLNNVTPKNKSWLLGTLVHRFDTCVIRDVYLRNPNDFSWENINQKTICYLDDEMFFQDYSWGPFFNMALKTLDRKNVVFIIKVEEFYLQAKLAGLPCVYEPLFHILDDLLGISKTKVLPQVKEYSDQLSYYCLNRNESNTRVEILRQLFSRGLLEHGYVTANFKLTEDIASKLKQDPYLNEVYHKNISSPERISTELHNIPISLNAHNAFHIAHSIPGAIALVSDTELAPDNFFPCEKGVLPFLTKRIPLVVGHVHQMQLFRNEGFDMFDDLVNYEYDDIPFKDIKNKVTSCLDKNNDLLKEKSIQNRVDFNNRVCYNQSYIVNQWLENKVTIFLNNIEECLNDSSRT